MAEPNQVDGGVSPSGKEIVEALLGDQTLGFKRRGRYLTKGICPNCGKKELFISTEEPWVVRCNRLNQCGWSESTRELYPELFRNYSERHPPTRGNPKATADAYMSHNRRFDLAVIGAWYEQERYRMPETQRSVETVRFYLDPERTRYWERLIDTDKESGQRINFGGARKADGSIVKGDWWMPPGQMIGSGDTVYLVEGIFHAIAFHLCGFKACAVMMAGNFPGDGIGKFSGQSVKWRLALDDDKAGRGYMLSHRKKLRDLDERVEVVLSGSDKDWDDLFRVGKLTESFLGEGLWRGRMFTAKNITFKAWAFYAWKRYPSSVLDFNNRLYGIYVDPKLGKELADGGILISEMAALDLFSAHASIVSISNCVPEFLYCERFALTDELSYFFTIDFCNHNPTYQTSFSGSGIESPPAFNKSLLNSAAGAMFDGNAKQFRLLRERWFSKKVLHVETLPFVGYDKSNGVYLYRDFAFHKGRELPVNEHGFFMCGKKPMKTKFRGFTIVRGDDSAFNTEWFGDFLKVFSLNGLACLAFWFGSLFAEQIRTEFKSFPFLEISGEHGTGKTTLLEFLWKLIGRDEYEGFDPSKSTFAARTRAFMQVSNLPIVLIESDRDPAANKYKQFDFEELKTAYNGRAIRSLGVFNRGNDIEEPPFRGSIVIAQNTAVEGTPALMSRIIQCHFTTAHFSPDTRALAPRFELASVEEMAGFLPRCLQQEDLILARFRTAFHSYLQEFVDLPDITDQRVIKNHSCLMALARSMQMVIPEMTNDVINQFNGFAVHRAVARQQGLSSDTPVVQGFWETYDLLNSAAISSGNAIYEQEELNHSADEAEIAISLTQFYQVCVEKKVETFSKSDLRKALPGSKSRKYLGQRNVRSQILNRTIWCWIFSKHEVSI